MAEPRPVKFTYEDYVLFPDDGKRHELIDGDHYVTPAPNTRHQTVVVSLTRILSTHARAHRLGRVFTAPYDVLLSDVDVVEPDLLFVSSSRSSLVTEKHLRGAPDLAIEILSESSRKTDEVVKRKLYERFGVREYWVVDPVVETVKVYVLEGVSLSPPRQLSKEAGDTLSTPLLPGLVVALAEVFE